jgi:hypothetical protein
LFPHLGVLHPPLEQVPLQFLSQFPNYRGSHGVPYKSYQFESIQFFSIHLILNSPTLVVPIYLCSFSLFSMPTSFIHLRILYPTPLNLSRLHMIPSLNQMVWVIILPTTYHHFITNYLSCHHHLCPSQFYHRILFSLYLIHPV